MDRRGFLKSTGVAAALVAAPAAATSASAGSSPAGPAVLTGPRRFGMSSNWVDSVSGPADMAHRLALRIHEASGGQLQLTLKHTSPTNTSASFADSEMEFYHGCEHDRSPLHPAFAYFTGLPSNSGLAAADLETWISYSGGQELWDDLAASYGGSFGYRPYALDEPPIERPQHLPRSSNSRHRSNGRFGSRPRRQSRGNSRTAAAPRT